ncbi:MAG: FecR domain-containing protein [Candidatus Pseudobacter hemicellulosilyticus]|uniref:FecR domain-containing protein n=1 Tax=Candidatus Pseudobacter hemicellulosilyticus TaxID=3121375 RepID=A0AAJ5WWC4_9BACT|nr:MAG: FecR domain-containing protein [Pseudobacter sp.]
MQIDKTIIEKFLQGRCTPEEARKLHRYLNDHPGLIREWFGKDWEEAGAGPAVDSQHAAGMYHIIEERIHGPQRRLLRALPWAAVAAAITGLCIWLAQPTGQQATAPVQLAVVDTVVRSAPAVSWRQQQNTSGRPMKLNLPDGSQVSLSPDALIKYAPGFDTDKREIHVEGEASFNVAQEKNRPFTVYAGGLATTALGTSFRISTTASSVRVQLLTGKVVVKAIRKTLPGWKKDVYLLPGQHLKYDVVNSLVKLSGTGKELQDIPSPATAPDPVDTPQQMVFDNTPLPEVFNKLKAHYNLSIEYTAKELEGLSFTGTIFYTDSLPILLQAIGRMNDLAVTSIPTGFSITKANRE